MAQTTTLRLELKISPWVRIKIRLLAFLLSILARFSWIDEVIVDGDRFSAWVLSHSRWRAAAPLSSGRWQRFE